MNYGEVLSGAWQIIRKHRALWIFGILAGCGEGGGGGGGNAFQASGDEFPPEAERFFEQTIGSISEEQLFGIIAVVVLVLLIVFLIAIFLSNIGRIGLIRGTLLAEGGEQNIPFGELFQGSLPYFWRLLGLYLLVGLVILVLAIPVTLLFFAFGALTAGIGLICLIPLICLLVPLIYALRIVLEQASIAIVAENLGVIDGLQRGWEVFRANIGPMILMALILFLGVQGIIGFLLALPFALIVIPVVLAIMAGSDPFSGGGFAVAALCFIIYLPIFIVLDGIVRSYVGSAWTLTYMRLTGQGPPAEIDPALSAA